MRPDDPLTDEAEDEIGALKIKGEANGWKQPDIHALFQAFDKWLGHPRLLDPKDTSFLRFAVLNELTWLISTPIIGAHAWEHIRGIAKRLGPEDPHELRESWRIATFELAAEPPECPDFLEKLFTLAQDEDTRWAVFSAYENFPWRLRPHAIKYSNGLISDQDCEQWLINQNLGDDEILMQKGKSEHQDAPLNP
jgi:hypothetical protein